MRPGACSPSRWRSSRGRPARAPGGDPHARPRDRPRPGRAEAPRQPARPVDVVRRSRAGARPGGRVAARAPARHADGAAGGRKSRLALEVARALEGEARDGAWRVDLARAGSPDDVVRLVAGAVDARGADPLARAVARLRDGDAILLLDACEPVVQEAARVAAAVLAECPGVRVLATSREVLHLPGEVRVTVEPLALPDPESTDGTASPAAQLFLDRARAARPRFELTPRQPRSSARSPVTSTDCRSRSSSPLPGSTPSGSRSSC